MLISFIIVQIYHLFRIKFLHSKVVLHIKGVLI